MLKLLTFAQSWARDAAESLQKREEGQTMAEYGVVLAVITLIVVVSIGFLSGAIAGARKAAVSRQDPNRNSAVMSAVRSSASDLTSSKLSVSPPSSTWDPGADVTVTASYPYSISLLGFAVKSGQLSSTTTERVE